MSETMPNLRLWEPSDSSAKHVDDTAMLNTKAKECPETVTAENKNTELVNAKINFGELGARGRN